MCTLQLLGPLKRRFYSSPESSPGRACPTPWSANVASRRESFALQLFFGVPRPDAERPAFPPEPLHRRDSDSASLQRKEPGSGAAFPPFPRVAHAGRPCWGLAGLPGPRPLCLPKLHPLRRSLCLHQGQGANFFLHLFAFICIFFLHFLHPVFEGSCWVPPSPRPSLLVANVPHSRNPNLKINLFRCFF